MRCPYCTSDVPDEALVCAHCARDLYLVRSLREQIGLLEQAATGQAGAASPAPDARIGELEKELADLRAQQAAAVPAAAGAGYLAALMKALLLTLVLLVAAHGLLLFVYDVKPLYLRIATILLPMPFGLLLAMKHPGRLTSSAVGGFVMAAAAVFAMLFVTATIDKVPVLPQDLRDAKEILEYGVSIGLAFLTGLLAGRLLHALRAKGSPPHRVALILSRAVVADEKGEFGIEKAAKRIETIIKVATPAATFAAAIYSGIKAFLGDPG